MSPVQSLCELRGAALSIWVSSSAGDDNGGPVNKALPDNDNGTRSSNQITDNGKL